VWVDANIFVRLLTDDPPELAAKAEALMSRAARGEVLLLVPVVVIAEVVWALVSFYRHERPKIATGLRLLITADGVAVEGADGVLDALTLMADHNVDFADAYLAAMASSRAEEVATFDTDFKRLGARMLAL
jgi:predicted nucleic acid-binding protein